jgi:hypothetical protein
MVRFSAAIAIVLAFAFSAEACTGWYQCKYNDGSHCCVRHFCSISFFDEGESF